MPSHFPERERTTEHHPERVIEMVFRIKTDMYDGELDDFLGHASEELFPDYRDEDPERVCPYAIYVPTGSHWRDTAIDPAAADLPGGNR